MSKFNKGDNVFVLKGCSVMPGTYEPPFYANDADRFGGVRINGAIYHFGAYLIQPTREEAAQAYMDYLKRLNDAKRVAIAKNEKKMDAFRKKMEKACISISP